MSPEDYFHQAFELDKQGIEGLKVEELYKKALEEDPSNVEYWSRYIRFTITHGVHPKTVNEEWQRCINSIDINDETYHKLHLKIVRLDIHRVHLERARKVLESVPERINTSQYWDLLHKYEFINKHNSSSYFPSYIPYDEWWNVPHLLPSKEQDGLTRVIVGKCEEIISNTGELFFLVVTINIPRNRTEFVVKRLRNPSYDKKVFGYLTMKQHDFNEKCEESYTELRERKYVEMYEFESGEARVSIHPLVECCPFSPPDDLDTRRFLRHWMVRW